MYGITPADVSMCARFEHVNIPPTTRMKKCIGSDNSRGGFTNLVELTSEILLNPGQEEC